MLVNVIELRASNWGRNETDRTVGAGDSMNGCSSVIDSRVIIINNIIIVMMMMVMIMFISSTLKATV